MPRRFYSTLGGERGVSTYHKIPVISPGHRQLRKDFLVRKQGIV